MELSLCWEMEHKWLLGLILILKDALLLKYCLHLRINHVEYILLRGDSDLVDLTINRQMMEILASIKGICKVMG
jgi:hypothetical protein